MRLLILLAASAAAAPVANLVVRTPDAEAVALAEPQWGGCGGSGPPCWKKDAIPEPEPEVEARWGGCGGSGPPCWKKDAIPEPEPEAEPQWGGCGGSGPPCWKKDAIPEPEPEAEPQTLFPSLSLRSRPGGAAAAARVLPAGKHDLDIISGETHLLSPLSFPP
ncbi:hypothetical protein CcaverHIS002_0704720 [Cutaneotrichosporon cavernicola]|nr:hypothetical protein CcaverHIS002_0704720 [Cutaneotrichosporon cavernicola]